MDKYLLSFIQDLVMSTANMKVASFYRTEWCCESPQWMDFGEQVDVEYGQALWKHYGNMRVVTWHIFLKDS